MQSILDVIKFWCQACCQTYLFEIIRRVLKDKKWIIGWTSQIEIGVIKENSWFEIKECWYYPFVACLNVIKISKWSHCRKRKGKGLIKNTIACCFYKILCDLCRYIRKRSIIECPRNWAYE